MEENMVLLMMDERAAENRATPDERSEFGRRLRKARQNKELTLEQVGDALMVATPSVSRWESGNNWPTPDRLERLADLYSVSVDWLLKGDRTIRKTGAGYSLGLARPTGAAGLEELSLTAVPVLGAISAGGLVEAWQEDLGALEVPTYIRRLAPRAFGLRVYGSSLASEWINDGSIVVVDPDAPFVDGKIYAVRLDGGQVAARRVIEAGSVLKLVTGDGEIS
jgi:repressor LexA